MVSEIFVREGGDGGGYRTIRNSVGYIQSLSKVNTKVPEKDKQPCRIDTINRWCI